jgi:hypothetical protein
MREPLRILLAGVAMILLGGMVLAVVGKGRAEINNNSNHSSAAGSRLEAAEFQGSLIGMQYEGWFTPKNAGDWKTAEAVPIVGKYSSYDVAVIKKHAEWFADLGIDWLLLDWSNMLWMQPAWEQHTGATKELEDTTELLLKTYAQLNREGKRTPKVVLLLGLYNGVPVTDPMKRLNGIVAWITQRLLANPEYKNQWLYYHGKPLVTVLFNPARPCQELKNYEKPGPLMAPDWTVRWMASQLQMGHAEKCGMWSWMDGTIQQMITYADGKAEETVVTPACFAGGGWLANTATGRDHGAPYIKSWKVAFEAHPKFIQVHQWNEFAGQAEGEGYGPDHRVYVDEYNQEFSDDIEPTQLDGCAYRGCGGWGYYYMNLTKALISLYRQETPGITVMALSAPFQASKVNRNRLRLAWESLGASPKSYVVQVDGNPVAKGLQGSEYTLDLSALHPGRHSVRLIAEGAYTYFDLDPEKITVKSTSRLPVTSTIQFTYSPESR